MESADYHSLNDEVDEIRLLRLLPGHFDSPIHVQLYHQPLQEAKYAALSYCWGQNVSNRVEIAVDYNNRYITTSVSENLGSALNHLRDQNEDLILWVDAICINQNNIMERNSQVQLMGSIYMSCKEVLAWLGPGTLESDRTMITLQEIVDELRGPLKDVVTTHSLKDVYFHMQKNLRPFGYTTENMKDHTELDHGCVCGSFDYQTLFDIMNGTKTRGSSSIFADSRDIWNREWWGRVWIIQEYLLARNVVFICGQHRLDGTGFDLASTVCDSFESVVAWHASAGRMRSAYQSLRHPDTGMFISVNRVPYKIFDRKIFEQDIFTAVVKANEKGFKIGEEGRGATDPRDRIYALLGISHVNSAIRADYKKKVEQVYIEFAQMALRSGGLALMTFLRPSKNELKLPSWCLDLSALHVGLQIQRRLRTIRPWSSTPKVEFAPNFLPTSIDCPVMIATGRILGRIAYTSPSAYILHEGVVSGFSGSGCAIHPNRVYSTDYENLCCLWIFELYNRIASVAGNESDAIDATCAVLSCRIGSEKKSAAPTTASVTSCNDFFNWCIFDYDTAREKNGSEFYSARRYSIAFMAENQRIVVTNSCHAGYAVKDVQQDDLAVILYGCPHPLIFREAKDVKDKDRRFFRVVGPAHFGTLKESAFTQISDDVEQVYII